MYSNCAHRCHLQKRLPESNGKPQTLHPVWDRLPALLRWDGWERAPRLWGVCWTLPWASQGQDVFLLSNSFSAKKYFISFFWKNLTSVHQCLCGWHINETNNLCKKINWNKTITVPKILKRTKKKQKKTWSTLAECLSRIAQTFFICSHKHKYIFWGTVYFIIPKSKNWIDWTDFSHRVCRTLALM